MNNFLLFAFLFCSQKQVDYSIHATISFSKIIFLCLVINFSTHSPFFLACSSSFSSYLFLYIYYFFCSFLLFKRKTYTLMKLTVSCLWHMLPASTFIIFCFFLTLFALCRQIINEIRIWRRKNGKTAAEAIAMDSL
jgi:hypothetical protein